MMLSFPLYFFPLVCAFVISSLSYLIWPCAFLKSLPCLSFPCCLPSLPVYSTLILLLIHISHNFSFPLYFSTYPVILSLAAVFPLHTPVSSQLGLMTYSSVPDPHTYSHCMTHDVPSLLTWCWTSQYCPINVNWDVTLLYLVQYITQAAEVLTWLLMPIQQFPVPDLTWDPPVPF